MVFSRENKTWLKLVYSLSRKADGKVFLCFVFHSNLCTSAIYINVSTYYVNTAVPATVEIHYWWSGGSWSTPSSRAVVLLKGRGCATPRVWAVVTAGKWARQVATETFPLHEDGEKELIRDMRAWQSEMRGKRFPFQYFHGGKSREQNFQNEILLVIWLSCGYYRELCERFIYRNFVDTCKFDIYREHITYKVGFPWFLKNVLLKKFERYMDHEIKEHSVGQTPPWKWVRTPGKNWGKVKMTGWGFLQVPRLQLSLVAPFQV